MLFILRSLVAQLVKNKPEIQENWFNFWVRKVPWRRDRLPTPVYLAFPCGLAGKESTCNVGHLGLIPGLGISPGERMVTHSHILDWRILWTVQSLGSQTVRQDWVTFPLSDMRITTLAFFGFPFAWNISFHPLTFSLYVSFSLKWVSCRQHIYGSCFDIHSTSLYLLVGAFIPFTFKVIIYIYIYVPIFSLIVWALFL